jgi:hypothetical protein
MSISEIIKSATYLVDTDGNKKAVQVDWSVWQELLDILEDQEDDRRWDELFAAHPEVMERLAAEAEIEIKAGRTRELIPEEL